MKVLGLHDCFDAGAALVVDGALTAAVNEERLNRVKQYHETNRRFLRVFNITTDPAIPAGSLQACLELGDVTLQELDAVALIRVPRSLIVRRRLWEIPRLDPVMALRTAGGLAYDLPNRLASLGNLRRLTGRALRSLGIGTGAAGSPPLQEVSHHRAHAASALRTSGWREALVVTTDMEGDLISTAVWEARDGVLRRRRHTCYQLASAGVFYGVVTAELGFRMHVDEWKVMGLAAYGDADRLAGAFHRALFFHAPSGMLRSRLEARLLRLWIRHLRWTHRPEDVAAAAQRRLEEVFCQLVNHWLERTGHRRLALAGGVAHNVKMNARLRSLPGVEEVHVFPHPGDGGLAAGAALEAHARLGGEPDSVRLACVALGPAYEDGAIAAAARAAGVALERPGDLGAATARLLAEGRVVGWFQGRMEYGPRSLGCRSILVHPGAAAHRDRVNAAVKFREWWRPFALSVLEEEAHTVLDAAHPSPFMTFSFRVRPEVRSSLAAITHVDGTTRPQTVSRQHLPRYHELLRRFRELTGLPGVLNTSFNRAGEPIVCTPADAFACYLGSGMDALAIGGFLAVKEAGRDPTPAPTGSSNVTGVPHVEPEC
jgi:carbamoyltransferase